MSKRTEELKGKIEAVKVELEQIKQAAADNKIAALQATFNDSITKKTKDLAGLQDTLARVIESEQITGRDWETILKDDKELMTAYNDTKRIGDKVVDNSKEFKTAVILAERNQLPFILLQGPTGTGKTTFMRALGAKINTPVISINASTGMEEQHLIGDWVPTGQVDESGKEVLKFNYGPLIKAMKHGICITIEEINMAKPGVAIILNSVIDDLRQITIPQTGEVIKAAPGFILAGTFNRGYEGGRPMNRAFLNRAALSVKIDTMSGDKVKGILEQTVPTATKNEINIAVWLYESIVNMIKRKQFDSAISIRQLVNLLRIKMTQRTFEESGKINTSWTNSIDSAIVEQVACGDEDVERELALIKKKLAESLDKITGELKETQAMFTTDAKVGSVLDNIKKMAQGEVK